MDAITSILYQIFEMPSFKRDYDNAFGKISNILNHFVIAGHIFISKNLEAIVGYNHLRRKELNMGLSGNGLNGFSTGIKVSFQNLQVLYARSLYQRNVTLNQIGINVEMNSFFSPGKL